MFDLNIGFVARVLGVACACAALACENPNSDSGPSCAELAPQCAETQQICVDTAEAGAVCEFCPDGEFIGDGGECVAIGGRAIRHEFTEFTVPPGEEIKDLCQSWTLNNEEELWVSAVEMRQNYASHHSIWSFVPDDIYDGPDGVWWCDERDFSDITAAVAGGNLYNQSTQTAHETQRFADGAAVRIPPYSRVVGDIHLLNTTREEIEGTMELTLYAQEKADVVVPLVPVELVFTEVFVPSESKSKMVVECDLAGPFAVVDEPVDFSVYHALPHAHERARRLFIEVIGGPMDGLSILNDTHYATFEPRGYNFAEPLQVQGATGLRFGCEYDNTDPFDYRWGYKEEMCQFSMFVDSALGFSAGTDILKQVDDENGMQVRQGMDCEVVAALWSHDKPGGPGPSGEGQD